MNTRSLIVGALSLHLGALACLAQQRTSIAEAPPPRVEVPRAGGAVPMTMVRQKPSIELMINGHGPFEFLFDTGCSPQIVLDGEFAREIGLESAGVQLMGDPASPQSIEAQVHEIAEVRIGSVVCTGVVGVSHDRSGIYGGDAPKGVIGLPLFEGATVVLDYPGGEFRIEPAGLPSPEEDARVVPYSRHMGAIPEIEIDIAGVEAIALIDTGAVSELMVHEDFAKTIPLDGEPEVIGRGRTVANDFEILAAPLDGDLGVGSTRAGDVRVTMNSLFDHANLGSGFLGQFVLSVDTANDRLRLEAVEGAKKPERPKRYGVMFRPDAAGGPLVVHGVVPGSPAEKAGLRTGDVVLTIDGETTAGRDQMEIGAWMRRPELVLGVEREGEEIKVRMELGG